MGKISDEIDTYSVYILGKLLGWEKFYLVLVATEKTEKNGPRALHTYPPTSRQILPPTLTHNPHRPPHHLTSPIELSLPAAVQGCGVVRLRVYRPTSEFRYAEDCTYMQNAVSVFLRGETLSSPIFLPSYVQGSEIKVCRRDS